MDTQCYIFINAWFSTEHLATNGEHLPNWTIQLAASILHSSAAQSDKQITQPLTDSRKLTDGSFAICVGRWMWNLNVDLFDYSISTQRAVSRTAFNSLIIDFASVELWNLQFIIALKFIPMDHFRIGWRISGKLIWQWTWVFCCFVLSSILSKLREKSRMKCALVI